MKAAISPVAFSPVADPARPWHLPRLGSGFPKYPYRMSSSEWKALLARAVKGDAEAEWEVATRFDDGCKDKRGRILVRPNARRAAAWHRRAAEHGSVSAQITLGVILGGGYGIERDTEEALFWLKRAFQRERLGCAANNIAITYREEGNLREAVLWFKNAVEAGDDGDRVQLGIHYYWGKGIRADYAAAVRCFQKATKGKNICEFDRDDAYFYLGIAYLEGKGVRKSLNSAVKHLERANKDNDHPAAQRVLKRISMNAIRGS